jgi:hypothetical protein
MLEGGCNYSHKKQMNYWGNQHANIKIHKKYLLRMSKLINVQT